jgi:hypothetical protein
MDEPQIDKTTGEILSPPPAPPAPAVPVPMPRIRFADWLKTFNSGALDDELSAELDAVAEAVMLQGKVGTVTLKLSMKDDGGGLIVQADVNGKPPRETRSAFFFHDRKRGGLSRRDPLQPQMPGMEDQES